MKQFRRLALLAAMSVGLLMVSSLSGCKTAVVAPPLAPGFNNAQDQQIGSILSGARAFYDTIQCETQSLNWDKATSECVADPSITAPLVLSATMKSSFNDFGTALNAANQVYLDYHSGTATEAAAQTQANLIQQKQSALQIPGVN